MSPATTIPTPSVDLPPATDRAHPELASQLGLGVNRLARVLRHHSSGDLSSSLLSALSSLDREGPLTLGELASVERVTPPTVTRLASRLEELGLVTRSTDPVDRRVARVTLTPAGAELLVTTRGRRDAYLADRIAALPAEDQATLSAAVTLLDALAGPGPGHGPGSAPGGRR